MYFVGKFDFLIGINVYSSVSNFVVGIRYTVLAWAAA